jgi:class 3 adenylate cyclase
VAERLEPRQVAEILIAPHSAMSEVIDRQGGTLNEFVGDAVMVVFGVPEPRGRPRRGRPEMRPRPCRPGRPS